MTLEFKYDFSQARMRTANYAPYLFSAVCNLIPVERPGLGTLAVDKYMRVYYDPAMFEQWTLDEMASVIIHETYHVLFMHCKRALKRFGEKMSEQDREMFNIAGDISINPVVRDMSCTQKSGKVFTPKLPGEPLYPAMFGFPEGLTMEEYLDKLNELPKKQLAGYMSGGESEPGDSDSNGESGAGNGSDGDKPAKAMPGRGGQSGAADGQDHPWELGSPEASGVEGIDEFKKTMIERKVASEVLDFERQKGRGSVPADLLRHCEDMLYPPADPYATLRSMVASCTTMSVGVGDFTYRKLARRQIPGIRLPASYRPTPKVAVVIDTSGSMADYDLSMALGVVQQGLKRLPPSCITVLTGDTTVGWAKKVMKATEVQLVGGGGTDMACCLQQADELKPDAIILVSDGETGYPDEPLHARKVIVALTRSGCKEYVPDWCEVVDLSKSQRN